jgi:regulator of replication initiation timing
MIDFLLTVLVLATLVCLEAAAIGSLISSRVSLMRENAKLRTELEKLRTK